MSWSARVVTGLVVCSVCVVAAVGQEPPAKPRAKVELRWVENERVEGLTEDKPFMEGEGGTSYAHKKTALVLTRAEVAEARLTEIDWSNLGLRYSVTLHLTKEARGKLAASYNGGAIRELTTVVDGKCWGTSKFYLDQPGATLFAPFVGFFSSKAEAQRLVDAFK
jgi:hypothetical protein